MKIQVEIKFLIFLFIVLILNGNVYSFPGDHISYTCKDYRRTQCKLENTYDPNNPINQSCIIHIDSDISIWGDSITAQDTMLLNGNKHPAYFGTNTPVGIYGGETNLGLIDSWDDYFSIFGKPQGGEPIKVDNRGQSGDTSDGLLSKVLGEASLVKYPDDLTQSEIENATCKAAKESALRSVIMIGGNDSWQKRMGSLWLPFLAPHINNHIKRNIINVIDWNLENGKYVLLEGNLPAFPHKGSNEAIKPLDVVGYDSFVINRNTLCNGQRFEKLEPWWLILIPGVQKAYLQQAEHIIKVWTFFAKALFNMEPSVADKDKDGLYFGLFTTTSIGLACLNDSLVNDIVPRYENQKDNINEQRVKINSLYNHFSRTNGSGYNFWMPHTHLWMDSIFPGDPAHYGPLGYSLRGEVTGSKLKSLGWNLPGNKELSKAIDGTSLVNASKKILDKAKLIGRYDEAVQVTTIEIGGGYKKELSDIEIYYKSGFPSDQDKAYFLSGIISGKYKELGGPAGSMGFPTSDIYLVHYNTIYHADFECGTIENNMLDFLNSTYVQYHNPKPEGCK